MKAYFLFALVLVIGAGCTTYQPEESSPSEESAGVVNGIGENVPQGEVSESSSLLKERGFEEAGIGFTGPADKEYRSFFSWDEMAAYIPPEDMFTPIDFSTDMVLACFMGEKPTGGYMNLITRLEESSDSLTVYVQIEKPREGDLVAQMVTYPWYAVVTEITDKKIVWDEIRANR